MIADIPADAPEPSLLRFRTGALNMAGMFARVFQRRKGVPGSELPRYFENILFPDASNESRSRVFLDAQGDVRGFIGIWPRRMVLHGRTIEAAIAGSMMVDQPEVHPTAGANSGPVG